MRRWAEIYLLTRKRLLGVMSGCALPLSTKGSTTTVRLGEKNATAGPLIFSTLANLNTKTLFNGGRVLNT